MFFYYNSELQIRLFSNFSCFCGEMARLDGKMVKSFISHVRFQDTTSKIMWVQMSSLLRVFLLRKTILSLSNIRSSEFQAYMDTDL